MKAVEYPIGIFDSGIGGLTVAGAMKKVLPHESFIYFGDTAHLPYGEKSSESIRHYAAKIVSFLVAKKCKMIVIACNTASAHAFKIVQDVAGPKIPVINVIDPVAEYTAKNYHNCAIGVIGTKGTIQSRVYVNRIEKMNKSLKVVSNATPLLAPMIEEGFYNNSISQTIINNYLSKKSFSGIDALILGCTHYPLIKKEVDKYYQKRIEIIDSAAVVAQTVKQLLEEKNLANATVSKNKHRFYVSDYTDSFEQSTRIFFDEKIDLLEARIWDQP
ncbi:MAG: glutamate racemase [Crocinitomicaceae bacterium]|nr:glutamate racemase [Crocinitomicaceae bacterium]